MGNSSLMAKVFEGKGNALNLGRGVRVMVAVIVPLIVLVALNSIDFAISASIGALLVAYCDVAKPYPTQARVLFTGTFAGALLFALGRAISPYSWEIAVPSIFLATLLLGFCAAYGQVVALIALLMNVTFLVGLGRGGGPSVAPGALLGFAMGGLITTLLFLLPWLLQRSQHEHANSTQLAQQASNGTSQSLFVPFLTQFKFHTPESIFSLMKALGAALAAGISWGFALPYPQWAPTTEIINTLPNPRMSFVVILQCVIGTVLGALFAAFLILTLAKTVVFLLIIAVTLLIGFTVKDVNAGLFLFFMTNYILILISFNAPDDISHVVLRILETLVGVGIAFRVEIMLMWISSQQKTKGGTDPPPTLFS